MSEEKPRCCATCRWYYYLGRGRWICINGDGYPNSIEFREMPGTECREWEARND